MALKNGEESIFKKLWPSILSLFVTKLDKRCDHDWPASLNKICGISFLNRYIAWQTPNIWIFLKWQPFQMLFDVVFYGNDYYKTESFEMREHKQIINSFILKRLFICFIYNWERCKWCWLECFGYGNPHHNYTM